MTRRSWAVLGPTLVVGCSLFDTSGVGSGGASVGEGTAGETGAEETSGDDDDGEETSSMSSGSTTSTSTNDTTSSATSADTASSSSSSSTDPTDPTTGNGSEPAYPNCIAPNTCADAAQNCLELLSRAEIVANVCAPPCRMDDCPQPETGDATPVCYANLCRLECADGQTCPAGMECFTVTPDGFVCAYPV